MAERSFQTINFRSVEYLLGTPQQHDLADILLHFPRPFGVSHAPGLKQGMNQYEMALWDADDETVWLGVNHNPFSGKKINEPGGLFYLQRDRQRLLYEPNEAIPLRDSYRGFYQNDFGTTAKLTDLIALLESEIPIYQITSLMAVPGVKEFLREGGLAAISRIEHHYAQLKPGSSVFQPFRLEGRISLENIKQRKLHTVEPIDGNQDWESFANKLAEGW